jgi:hypothetical protein
VLGGVGVGRPATAVIVAFVAVLVTVGCRPERPSYPPVVVAAGDIADCSGGGDEATARLVGDIGDSTVLTLGDEAYPDGSAEDFEECYDPTWGRFEDRTKPVPGNHEYDTPGTAGYFHYFGRAAGDPGKGYYSYNLGKWHIVALNSNCKEEEIGDCEEASQQVRWLKADLAANKDKRCTLAYMHHPRFSSGKEHGNTHYVKPLWEALYEGGPRWSSPATSTTTNASPRRTRSVRQTPSAASGSSWWAPAAARATTPSWSQSPTARFTAMIPTAC